MTKPPKKPQVGGQHPKPLPKARDFPEPDLEDVLEYQKGQGKVPKFPKENDER
jgi:hypothetical protein